MSARERTNRYWGGFALAVLTTVLTVVTGFWPDWIELVFRADPDGGDGTVERAVIVVLACASVLTWGFTYTRWKRATQHP